MADKMGIEQKIDLLVGRFDSLERKVEALDQRFDVVDRKVEALDQRFDVVDRKFEALDQRFDAMDRRFDAGDQRFDAADRKVDVLKTRMDIGFEDMRAQFRLALEHTTALRETTERGFAEMSRDHAAHGTLLEGVAVHIRRRVARLEDSGDR